MTDREMITLHRAWWRGDLDYGDYSDRLDDVDPDRYGRLLRRETVRKLVPGVLMMGVMAGLAVGVVMNDPPWDAIYAWAMVPLSGLVSWWSFRELTRCYLMKRQLQVHRRRHREGDGR